MRRSLIAAVAVAALAAACGDHAGSPWSPGDTAAPTSSTTSTTPGATAAASSCAYYDTDGCALYGLVLPGPLLLEEALTAASGLPGVPIAVYRRDPVCVLEVSMLPPGAPGSETLVASRFAYVDAEGIRQRRLATSGSVAPPITGMHISESYWNHWEDQWARAQEPGVLIEAVAVYLPAESVADGAPPGFRAVVRIPWRRTDSTDPSYAGELLVESEGFPAGYLSEPAPLDCG